MVNYYSFNTEKVLKCIFSVFFLFILIIPSYSQYWERHIGVDDLDECIYDLQETFDKGYLISLREVEVISSYYYSTANILKTDINGNILWTRSIPRDGIAIRGCKPLPDGSFVCTSGYWDTVNEMWNLMIYRIDACGEEIWCKNFIDSLGQGFQSVDIEVINNKIIFVRDRIRISGDEDPFTLIMLDLNGEIICDKPFLLREDYPLMAAPTIYKIQPLPNNELMALGSVYYAKDSTSVKSLRAMFIKFDSDGKEQWMYPFGVEESYYTYYSKCENVIIEDTGRYFGFSGFHTSPRKMLLIKFDDSGNDLGHVISPIDTVFGRPNPKFVGVQKIAPNRYLNLLHYTKGAGKSGKAFVIVDSTLTQFYDTLHLNINELLAYSWIKSFDGKYLLSGFDVQSDDIQGYYNKVSINPLSFDTMYTAPYTYDSLCPGIATSDTLYFEDCDVITGENDIQYEQPTKTPLLLYPNPTHDELTVSLGKATHISTVSITINTLTGEVQCSEDMLPGEQTTRLSTHSWPKGIYLVTARMGNEVVGREKIVVM